MVKDKTTVELTDPELMVLIELLVEYLRRKARSGVDTNGLPETALNVKLINARNEMVDQSKPLK